MAEKPPSLLTAGGPQNDGPKGKGGTLKYGHFLVSMLDFWGVYIILP